MRTRFAWVWFLLVSLAPCLFSQTSDHLPGLQVDEGNIRLSFELPARLAIPVVNNTGQLLKVRLRLELLEVDDKLLDWTDRETTILPGSHVLAVPWTMLSSEDSSSESYWWRLRYQVTPSQPGGAILRQGIVQFGTIATHWMQIEAVSVRYPKPGSSFPARVRVEDRRTSKGIGGVLVDAKIKQTGESLRSIASSPARTDGQGYALLTVNLPAKADSDAEVVITASRGMARTSKSLDLEVVDQTAVTISTDKPIYQPGQTLHVRALALAQADHVAANQSVTFGVDDEDDGTQFEQEAETSRFGIASADWEIPATLRAGYYQVWAELGGHRTRSEVRISRYELPEFTVLPVTGKPYYLPGDPLLVNVTASYLFGRPVRKGTVRVVRSDPGHWNSRSKQRESDEKEIQRGELDSSGKFSSLLDLQSDFDELDKADYERYRDVHLAAYVTDLSTNRTEQRRFTVRLSKEQIHVYAMNLPRRTDEPLDMYLTAAFPDGTPASVDLTVGAVKPSEGGGFSNAPAPSEQVVLAHLHTNSYGVARLRVRALRQDLLVNGNEGSELYSQGRLVIEARDKRGRRGIHWEQLWLEKGPYFHIKPLKRILQAGESVTAEIESSAPDQVIFVDLLGHEKVLDSKRVELHHGRADLEFAYKPEFRNSLYFLAYNMIPQREEGKGLLAGAEVLFPEPQDLGVDVRLGRTTYKPGEPAVAELRVRSPEGKPMESALGVLVYDRAVAERVRADQEFGSYGFYFYDYQWENYPTIGSVTYRDLLNQRLVHPVAPEMELVAQAILSTRDDDHGRQMTLQDDDYEQNAGSVFRSSIDRTLLPVEEALRSNYATTHRYPTTVEDFVALLAGNHIEFGKLLDPWGMPYYLAFAVQQRDAVLEIFSSGPSKRPGTSEEFIAKSYSWPFFTITGEILDSVAAEYTRKTGSYIRDLSTLRLQFAMRGINLDALRDPWGQPYTFTFDVDGPVYRIDVHSQGPPVLTGRTRRTEPLPVWQTAVRYFQQEYRALDQALADNFQATAQFPSNEIEIEPVLKAAGLSGTSLRDPWGNPYHFEFGRESRYANQMDISIYDENRADKLVPITQKLAWIYVVSYGKKNDPADKFEVASFSRVVAEESSRAEKPKPTSQVPLNGLSGAISGTVTDPQGAVIMGAMVHATDELSGSQYEATTDGEGGYLLRNLPAGRYRLEVQAAGFKASQVRLVPVASSNVTKVDVRLSVGGTSETVEVTAAPPLVEMTTAQVSSIPTQHSLARIEPQRQAFTPRLRKYFPETLVWRPELVTDSSGRAQLKFAMADNITTWKMSVIASNTEGQLGIAEKELRTFQPFFLDHEPPRILTVGDQIELPVVLRNYMGKLQAVDVTLEKASWFSVSSPAQQRVAVPAGEEATAHFLVSAVHSVHDGKERVSAANSVTGDALERPITVHPDGQSVTQTLTQVAAGEHAKLDLQIPPNTIADSIEAQIKIFPNFGAHVLDALRGMVERPVGCGEQITSIAFGSLLTLEVLRKAGQDDPQKPGNPNSELATRAHKYLTEGYQKLLVLQNRNGGFPYWVHQDPDLALTAYILDFLTQAEQFIDVDPDVTIGARKFLLASQESDGAWSWRTYSGKRPKDPNLTALIARSLAGAVPGDAAVNRALDFLSSDVSELNEPYLIGQYLLAAVRNGRVKDVARVRELLAGLAHEEGASTYWNLEANASPFYCWGLTGRIETTALAVQALVRIAHDTHDAEASRLADRGLVFLLAHKDRFGVWYSANASVNVLRTIIEAMPAAEPGEGGAATVVVNGKRAGQIQLPPASQLSGPLTANISQLLGPGANNIEVIRQEGSPIQEQVIATYYVPWADLGTPSTSGFARGESRALRLNVAFDHTAGQVGESIQCTVDAERIGFAGYGMMLAEIGLPPGADVDRSSLQAAMDAWLISEFEVQPDRVVVYIWPKAGGSRFTFAFRPRFPMNASTAPSTLYDYYNPEAQATVAPVRFTVR